MFGLVSNRTKPTHNIPRQIQLLEDRTVPAFVSQGPFQIQGVGGVGITPNNAAIGSIQAVAVDPVNADRMFVAAVNGGIWRTLNATSVNPTWTPLTDLLPTTAIGDLRFSPLDSNVLYAGTGDYTKLRAPDDSVRQSFSRGVYRSIDGGATWAVFSGNGVFDNQRIRTILPTSIINAGAGAAVDRQRVFAATYDATNPTATTNGLYRSNDGGQTWTKLVANGLPNLGNFSASDMIASPLDTTGQTLFLGIVGQGVYKSINGGSTWSLVATGVTAADYTNSSNIKFGFFNRTGTGAASILYVGITDPVQSQTVAYRSVDQGTTFTSLGTVADANGGIFPGNLGQAPFNFAVQADPTNPNAVYVGGRYLPLTGSNGIAVNAGRILRYDGTTWTTTTLTGAGGDAPSDGSRDLAVDAAGNLITVNDTGIYKLSTPSVQATRMWTTLNGNLAVTEFTQAQYDGVSNIYFGGAVLNGSPQQPTVGATSWVNRNSGSTGRNLPTGQAARVDTGAFPGGSIRYTSGESYVGFQREIYDANNVLQGSSTGLLAGLPTTAIGNRTNFVINSLDGTRIVFGGIDGGIYESFDRGDSVAISGTLPTQVAALAYGGIIDGVRDGDLIYAGALNGGIYRRVRPFDPFTLLTSYTGGTAESIAVDPNNGARVYVADINGRIFFSGDAGNNFIDITNNLPGLTTEGIVLTVVDYTPSVDGDEFVLVGGRGGVYAANNTSLRGFNWTRLSNALPSSVVNDLQYIPQLDKLVVSLQGRGIWSLDAVKNELFGIPVANSTAFTIVGSDVGSMPLVRAISPDGTVRFEVMAFDPAFGGGVRVAQGDVTGDGINDYIVAAGVGGGPNVKVFNGVNGRLERSFFAYDQFFLGGIYVAAGDVDGDGFADIVTGSGAGGGPHVKVFSGKTGAQIGSFFAYAAGFQGGVQVAVGKVNADGFADIITGTGPGSAPHVKVFSGVANFPLISSFFAYDSRLLTGVSVAAGDINGDGLAEVITSPLANAPAHIKGFNINNGGLTILSVYGFPESQTAGGRVATLNATSDGQSQIVVAPGPGANSIARRLTRTGALITQFSPLDEAFTGGLWVG